MHPQRELLGWYSVGAEAAAAHLHTHEALQALLSSTPGSVSADELVFLLLSSTQQQQQQQQQHLHVGAVGGGTPSRSLRATSFPM